MVRRDCQRSCVKLCEDCLTLGSHCTTWLQPIAAHHVADLDGNDNHFGTVGGANRAEGRATLTHFVRFFPFDILYVRFASRSLRGLPRQSCKIIPPLEEKGLTYCKAMCMIGALV